MPRALSRGVGSWMSTELELTLSLRRTAEMKM